MRTKDTLFEVDCAGGVAIVTPTADLGEFIYEQLSCEANKLLESFEARTARKDVVIEFGKKDYVGSSALGFLLKLWKAVRQRDGRMAPCNLSAHEQEILWLTMLDTLWPIYPSRDSALKTLANPSVHPENM